MELSSISRKHATRAYRRGGHRKARSTVLAVGDQPDCVVWVDGSCACEPEGRRRIVSGMFCRRYAWSGRATEYVPFSPLGRVGARRTRSHSCLRCQQPKCASDNDSDNETCSQFSCNRPIARHQGIEMLPKTISRHFSGRSGFGFSTQPAGRWPRPVLFTSPSSARARSAMARRRFTISGFWVETSWSSWTSVRTS